MTKQWQISIDEFVLACESAPKYKALALLIEQAIHRGELTSANKLPAQRWLADELAVTHGTVTRAYDLLEKRGLVSAKLGAGTYVNAQLVSPAKVQGHREYDFASSMQPMLGQTGILARAMQEVAQDPNALVDVMTYAHQGLIKHKMVFSRWLAQKNIQTQAEQIIFTQGAQQGIFTCFQLLCDAGDSVMHEALAYPGFFKAANGNQVNTLALTLTQEGVDLEQLEHYCQRHQPKFFYMTANNQNPTNIQYSKSQRERIIALSKLYDFYIIEDDVNYVLPENWHAPIQQDAPDRVLYLSSLSKYVAGGLRIAFALIPPLLQSKFNQSLHSQCWMNSGMNLEIACRFLMTEEFKHNQDQLANEMRYRQQAMLALLSRLDLSGVAGGLNVWLPLPLNINMHALNASLLEKNIKLRTADLFTDLNQAQLVQNGVRLSLGGFDLREEFDQGLQVLEQAILAFKMRQDIVI